MDYKKYIELGFKRTDLDDLVDSLTGYNSFLLRKEIREYLCIIVLSGTLNVAELVAYNGEPEEFALIINDNCVLEICNNIENDQ
jgi:hypothetical protein